MPWMELIMRYLAYGFCAMVLSSVLVGCDPSPSELRTTAISEFQVGHNQKAEELFQRVVDKHPTDPDSWYYLGRIAHADKKYERAIYCYQCAIDADPGYEPAKYWLKRAKADAGDVAQYLEIIPRTPDKPLP